MSKLLTALEDEHRVWLAKQQLFFVASAPLAADGHVNCSPRGGDSFRVLSDREVLFRDLTGSGAETAAHVRENGRIVIMFCGFDGPPRIMRFHGRAELILAEHPRWTEFEAMFAPNMGRRAYFRIDVDRITTSCGYNVPLYDLVGPRDVLDRWSEKVGEEGARAFRLDKNQRSLDGLPAFDPA